MKAQLTHVGFPTLKTMAHNYSGMSPLLLSVFLETTAGSGVGKSGSFSAEHLAVNRLCH